MKGIARAAELGLVGCRICGLVCENIGGHERRCPRCDAEIRSRKPHSISRTWALLMASVIIYVPANVLPVMHTQAFGDSNGGVDNTIMSGVIEFWQNGSRGISLLIFIASILIPSTKMIALTALLINARPRARTSVHFIRLYRMLELVGYWSMLDVLVVGLVTAVVKFRGVSDAEPRVGILYFGLVVVLTMLATLSFDPRLLWDRRARQT
jgi:paraquat-inducible protein A